jgi:hypothetical protein
MGYLDLAKKAIRTNPQWVAETKDPKTEIERNPFREYCSNESNEINEKDEICNVNDDLSEPNLGTYQAIFEQAVADLSKVYLPGTLEMIREDFPDLASKTQAVEDLINELWLKARNGVGDISAFRDEVERWKNLHLMGIKIFRFLESNN